MNTINVIDLQAWWFDCAMCGDEVGSSFMSKSWAVPWYCYPVREGESEGGYQTVCESCHDKWMDWEETSKPGDVMYDY